MMKNIEELPDGFIDEKTLESDRLWLRPCKYEDDSIVPDNRIAGNIEEHRRLGFGSMAVILKSDGAKIGHVGFQIKLTERSVIDAANRPFANYDAWGSWTRMPIADLQSRNGATCQMQFNTPDVDIYWFFDEAYWGRGYATEASNRLIRYGFEKLRLRRITAANIEVSNDRSVKLANRVGMTLLPVPYEPSQVVGVIYNPRLEQSEEPTWAAL